MARRRDNWSCGHGDDTSSPSPSSQLLHMAASCSRCTRATSMTSSGVLNAVMPTWVHTRSSKNRLRRHGPSLRLTPKPNRTLRRGDGDNGRAAAASNKVSPRGVVVWQQRLLLLLLLPALRLLLLLLLLLHGLLRRAPCCCACLAAKAANGHSCPTALLPLLWPLLLLLLPLPLPRPRARGGVGGRFRRAGSADGRKDRDKGVATTHGLRCCCVAATLIVSDMLRSSRGGCRAGGATLRGDKATALPALQRLLLL